MTRDELDERNTKAITHWWVTMRDTGKVAPGLLDDLAAIADEHTAGIIRAQLDHHDEQAAQEPVSPGAFTDAAVSGAMTTHRTRTRTRRTD